MQVALAVLVLDAERKKGSKGLATTSAKPLRALTDSLPWNAGAQRRKLNDSKFGISASIGNTSAELTNRAGVGAIGSAA